MTRQAYTLGTLSVANVGVAAWNVTLGNVAIAIFGLIAAGICFDGMWRQVR